MPPCCKSSSQSVGVGVAVGKNKRKRLETGLRFVDGLRLIRCSTNTGGESGNFKQPGKKKAQVLVENIYCKSRLPPCVLKYKTSRCEVD